MWAMHALRGAVLAAGVVAIALLLAAFLAPPVLTFPSAVLVWLASALLAMLAFALALAPALRYRGSRIARLLSERDPELATRLRSALELTELASPGVSGRDRAAALEPSGRGTASSPAAEGGTEVEHDAPAPVAYSRELVAAHLAEVERGLDSVPPARILPLRKLWHVSVAVGLFGLVVAGAALSREPAAWLFLRGLRSPADVRADGTRIAEVVKHFEVRISYPGYLDRPASTLHDPRELDVPAGSHIELRVTPLFSALRGTLRSAAGEIALTLNQEGELEGRFTAQASGRWQIGIEDRALRYEDPRSFELRVSADSKPSISIEDPHNGAFVTAEASIPLRFVANDDVGLAAVDMHVRTPDGRERQRRLFSALDDGGSKPTLRAAVELVPEELGAREGDTLVVWLEAQDEDAVHGPNVGKSAEVSLEVTAKGRTLSGFIPDLQVIADAAVGVLADRLESAVPDDSKQARARFTDLERGTRAWIGRLEALLAQADRSQAGAIVDSDQLRGVKRRTLRLLGHEAGLHGAIVRGKLERIETDARFVEELERDVLLLADMLAKAHVDEAKIIAEELRGLKQRIEGLLSELGKSRSPQAQRELMSEIAKAERRLAELAQSLSRMATRVPSEFVNREAVPQQEAQSSLADLERAVRENDLQAAADHLDALAKQIDDLAAQLGQGGLRLAESRFGPRDKALAAAQQRLGMLAAEQQRLAERSGEIAQGAERRGRGEAANERARSLAPQAEQLQRAVSDLLEESPPGWRSPAMSRAQERLRDARAALQTGDLAQARDMSEAGERSLREASAELSSEAGMFAGHRGETAERARRAERAQLEAERLAEAIERAMPDVSDHTTDAERERMRGDLDPQRQARKAAQGLEEAFSTGPDGVPLSPEAAEAMQVARESMRKAEQALEQGSADEAASEQRDASERLQAAAEQLARKQQGSSAAGGGGARTTERTQADGKVKIPGEADWKGPTELRRRLLDAMHEGSPSGFEAAVERYYEELLR